MNDAPEATTAASPLVGTRTGSSLPSLCSALYRNVAISARVVSRSGQNRVPSPHPLVIPDAASAVNWSKYQASAGTSEKPGSGPGARLKARVKNTAICARVTDASGQKRVPSPHPAVTPSSAMRSMNGAKKLSASTSENRVADTAAGSAPSRTRTVQTAIVLRSRLSEGQNPPSHSVPANTPIAASAATGSE